MYFKISFTAVKTIAKASNVITSTIYQYTPPFYKGAETAATVSSRYYYSIYVILCPVCKINKLSPVCLAILPIDIVGTVCYNIDSKRDSEHPITNGSLMCSYDKPTGHKTGNGTQSENKI